MLRLIHATLYRVDLQTRLPFRYGIANMTGLPHVFLRTEWEINKNRVVGLTAENLPPKWFVKQPTRDLDEEIEEMLSVIHMAVGQARQIRAETPFEFWWQLQKRMWQWAQHSSLPQLLAGLGTSLMERSLLDAFCRSRQMPLGHALQCDILCMNLGCIHPELRGHSPVEFLPSSPLQGTTIRQTIGLGDPLTGSDLPTNLRVNDGLPETLEENINTYSFRQFKIKICGNPVADEERLQDIFDILDSCAPTNWQFSLDGNENYVNAESFRRMWDNLMNQSWASARRHRLLFVEQPVHRANALTPASDWRNWPDAPPIIIDESDGEPKNLRTALALGYRGVSHKNCKGVFRGIANACLLRHRSRHVLEQPLFMSGEDLANIGPVALPQDLAVQAFLGNASVERNGHHYFRGLACWPEAWQEQALTCHPDLYYRTGDGLVTLCINQGTLSTASLNRAPFGVAPLFDPEKHFRPVKESGV